MTFDYTYTDKSGARRTESLEAASRAEAFGILKTRGITPISVAASNKRGARPVGNPPPNVLRGLVAGGVFIVLAIVVGLLVLKKTQAPEGRPTRFRENGRVAEVPHRESTAVPTNAVDSVTGSKIVAKVEPASPAVTSSVPEVVEVSTNASPTSAVKAQRPKPLFKTGVEQVMGWIFTTELGSAPPPLPNLSKKDIANIVNIILSKNEVDDRDSEKTAQAKQVVDLAKKELKQYLKDGGDPQSFLNYYHNELKKANDEWKDAQKLVLQSLKEEGAEAGVAFAEEVNKKLAEKGIKHVKIPPKYLKILAGEESSK